MTKLPDCERAHSQAVVEKFIAVINSSQRSGMLAES
jgi:hypothetical protein